MLIINCIYESERGVDGVDKSLSTFGRFAVQFEKLISKLAWTGMKQKNGRGFMKGANLLC